MTPRAQISAIFPLYDKPISQFGEHEHLNQYTWKFKSTIAFILFSPEQHSGAENTGVPGDLLMLALSSYTNHTAENKGTVNI